LRLLHEYIYTSIHTPAAAAVMSARGLIRARNAQLRGKTFNPLYCMWARQIHFVYRAIPLLSRRSAQKTHGDWINGIRFHWYPSSKLSF